jgi:probable F420-dependent oxidoreductase
MHFTFGFPLMTHPQNPELLDARALGAIALAAENAGFAAVSLTEHPIPHDDWLATGGHDALDPFVGLSFAAAATSRVRLLTNLTPLPYRNPALLAKTVATLDRLSGGRVILGVGTGYLEKEFAALGVDFEERNALFDESLEVMRKVWTGRSVTYRGRNFDIDHCTAHPTPLQEVVPVWVGGNSKMSLHRVAEKAQGWMPMPNPRSAGRRRRSAYLESEQDLVRMLDEIRAHAQSIGRNDPIDVAYMTTEGGWLGAPTFDASRHIDAIGALSRVGVTWVAGNVGGSSVAEIVDNLARYGQEVIAAV